MTLQEAEKQYIEAQGRYASELQRFAYSSRPNMVSLVKAGKEEVTARKAYMKIKREAGQ